MRRRKFNDIEIAMLRCFVEFDMILMAMMEVMRGVEWVGEGVWMTMGDCVIRKGVVASIWCQSQCFGISHDAEWIRYFFYFFFLT